jgi:hypothetical protein
MSGRQLNDPAVDPGEMPDFPAKTGCAFFPCCAGVAAENAALHARDRELCTEIATLLEHIADLEAQLDRLERRHG